MPADSELVSRLRDALRKEPGVSERRMFGGIAFLVNGNMCCGVARDLLMLRVGVEGAELALKDPHARPMDFTGKPMKSMVYVDGHGIRKDSDLQAWVQRALRFVRTLPPKEAKKARRK
jgi:TfoX/Sxy family transcriptional regulator of competence genes